MGDPLIYNVQTTIFFTRSTYEKFLSSILISSITCDFNQKFCSERRFSTAEDYVLCSWMESKYKVVKR